MKISAKCPACLLNRVYMECSIATSDYAKIEEAVGEALKILTKEYEKKGVNALIATKIHRRVYEILGIKDPYKPLKDRANEVAKRNLPFVESFISKLADRFYGSVVASIIGNAFDYGVLGHRVAEEDFRSYFLRMFAKGLEIDDTKEIKKLCRGKVVYVTDNAGEIFFDTLLVKEVKRISERVSVVVRGEPILSDATLEDARLSGMDKIADEILTNGGEIGIDLELIPEDTKERIEEADVIIAKGMANYECLSESDLNNVAFLLTAKCEPVARDIGVEVGSMVAMLK